MGTNGLANRDAIAGLARRAAWGLRPGELDRWVSADAEDLIEQLVAPDAAGIAVEPSPWAGFEYDADGNRAAQGTEVLSSWIAHLVATGRPFENSLSWFWHDHFAVSYGVVSHLPLVLDHLELLRRSAFDGFRQLIRDVTTDAAMLIFLDGASSTGSSPNENYGRELLELYTLGFGNFTEDDVRAAATALTGWVVARRRGYGVSFVEARHDSSPQELLGATGVSDVDGVVDAALAHSATAPHIAAKMARHFLGAVDAPTVAALAETFAASGMEVRVLARAILEAALDGKGAPIVTAPVPWTVAALKATGAEVPARQMLQLLRQMGQVPGNPPNVGGYPGSNAWLASSATAGRFAAASAIALATPDDAAVLEAAAGRDDQQLADLLLRPAGFSSATLSAFDPLSDASTARPGQAVLALALASPDFLIS